MAELMLHGYGLFLNASDDLLDIQQPMESNNTAFNVSTNDTCPIYQPVPFLNMKFALVGVVGAAVATMGIVANSVLVYVFFRPSVRLSTVLYLAVLAMLDIWMLLTYILIFPATTWYDYFVSVPLFRFWMFYVRPMLTISKIIQLSSTYLIVAATLERCLSQGGLQCTKYKRAVVIAVVLLTSVLLKWSTYLELKIEYRPECSGLSEKDVQQSDLAKHPVYRTVVAFYLTHIIHVFLPFFLLLILNILIILRMKRSTRTTRNETVRTIAKYPTTSVLFLKSSGMGRQGQEGVLQSQIMQRIETKRQVREATHMLLMIVSVYLVVNSVSLVVTTMEHVAPDFLVQHGKFYTFAVDAINFLSVANSSTRFLIYYCFNGAIRSEYKKLFRKFRGTFRHDYTPVSDRTVQRHSREGRAGRKGRLRNGHNLIANRHAIHERSAVDTDNNSIDIHVNGGIRWNEYNSQVGCATEQCSAFGVGPNHSSRDGRGQEINGFVGLRPLAPHGRPLTPDLHFANKHTCISPTPTSQSLGSESRNATLQKRITPLDDEFDDKVYRRFCEQHFMEHETSL